MGNAGILLPMMPDICNPTYGLRTNSHYCLFVVRMSPWWGMPDPFPMGYLAHINTLSHGFKPTVSVLPFSSQKCIVYVLHACRSFPHDGECLTLPHDGEYKESNVYTHFYLHMDCKPKSVLSLLKCVLSIVCCMYVPDGGMSFPMMGNPNMNCKQQRLFSSSLLSNVDCVSVHVSVLLSVTGST